MLGYLFTSISKMDFISKHTIKKKVLIRKALFFDEMH